MRRTGGKVRTVSGFKMNVQFESKRKLMSLMLLVVVRVNTTAKERRKAKVMKTMEGNFHCQFSTHTRAACDRVKRTAFSLIEVQIYSAESFGAEKLKTSNQMAKEGKATGLAIETCSEGPKNHSKSSKII